MTQSDRFQEGAPPAAERSHAVVTLRMSPQLHKALKQMAHRREVSLNQLCVNMLWQPVLDSPDLLYGPEKRNP